MPPLIRTRIRRVLREELVGYYLAEIEDLFHDEGFSANLQHDPSTSGERRTLVEQFYVGIDWTSYEEVHRFLRIVEQVRDHRAKRERLAGDLAEKDACRAWIEDFDRLLARDGLHVDPETGRIVLAGDEAFHQRLDALPDESAIPRHLDLMREKVEVDPYASIGSAKSAIEAALRHAAGIVGVEAGASGNNMPELISSVHRALALHPTAVAPDAEGAEAIKRALGGLTTIAVSVTELRNRYGDGHGRATDAVGLTSRHSWFVARCTEAYVGMILDTLAAPNAPWKKDIEDHA